MQLIVSFSSASEAVAGTSTGPVLESVMSAASQASVGVDGSEPRASSVCQLVQHPHWKRMESAILPCKLLHLVDGRTSVQHPVVCIWELRRAPQNQMLSDASSDCRWRSLDALQAFHLTELPEPQSKSMSAASEASRGRFRFSQFGIANAASSKVWGGAMAQEVKETDSLYWMTCLITAEDSSYSEKLQSVVNESR